VKISQVIWFGLIVLVLIVGGIIYSIGIGSPKSATPAAPVDATDHALSTPTSTTLAAVDTSTPTEIKPATGASGTGTMPTSAIPSLNVDIPTPGVAPGAAPGAAPGTTPEIKPGSSGPDFSNPGATPTSGITPTTQPTGTIDPMSPAIGAGAPMPTTMPATPPTKMHTVKSGDTLAAIAKQCYGSEAKWTIIAKANPKVDPQRLKIGQVLVIPDVGSTPAPGMGTATTPGTTGTDTMTGSSTSTSTPDVPLHTGTQTYKVQSGDTLWTIAQHFYGDGSKWPAIQKANKQLLGDNASKLKIGMSLIIPPAPVKTNVPTGAHAGEAGK